MLELWRRKPGRSISPIRFVAVLPALFLVADAGAAGSHYIDLRRIAPIHGDAAAGERKATTCHACHGVGNSVAPTFPRLAGQRAEYLYHRLVSFKTADPKDPYYSVSPMRPLAANLSDTDMRDLATYFSAQTPTIATPAAPPAAAPADAERGEAIFLTGDPEHGIPPCQGCHGADAGGTPIATAQYAAYPSLRGQYSLYLATRLTSFHNRLPHDTTNDFIMGDVASTLDSDSIQAVAAWLGSLAPSRPF
jgi:cytochrome c553